MLDAAQHASEFAVGLTRSTFENDSLRQYALARAVEVVGEAASNVTDEFQAKHPQVAWAQLKGMRIRLAHAYFDINRDVLWRAVTVEFPVLIRQLQLIVDDQS